MKILKQIDKKKSLKSIGASVGKDHATVLHSLNNYDMFEQFNPTLKLFRKQILQRLNYASTEQILDMSKDEFIESLQIDIMKLTDEIANLQETITNLQKPRNNYKIVNNIETLLLETEGKEQQEIIIALSGCFDVIVNDGNNNLKTITLNRPYYGLYISPMTWRHIENFSTNALALHLSSHKFLESDYIRDFNLFKTIKEQNASNNL